MFVNISTHHTPGYEDGNFKEVPAKMWNPIARTIITIAIYEVFTLCQIPTYIISSLDNTHQYAHFPDESSYPEAQDSSVVKLRFKSRFV